MTTRFEAPLVEWYAAHARDLPWRGPGLAAWPVLVSEFMLQQTPVARVLPAYDAWLARWPTATALASATPADAVRQWGRLGYPRRALRLHACAQVITSEHGGEVPALISDLLALPGVGAYTAAAVAAFAFGQRQPVLDTNVRRVLARLVTGAEPAGRSSASVAEIALADVAAAARRRAPGGNLVGRGDGTRRADLHGSETSLRPVPGGRVVRLAARRPARRATSRAAPSGTRAATGSAVARCSRYSGARRARSRPTPSSTAGPNRTSASASWPDC